MTATLTATYDLGVDEWLQLGPPWQACFASAWEAFLAGTIPVGAAVAGPDGSVVAQGRNRIFDPPGEGLAGSRLAHAEVDALVQLPVGARYQDHVLYSTLEPCLLCVAATLHATVGRIEYAAPDPFGGGCTGTIDTAHWQRSAPEIAPPLGGSPGRLSSALHSAFWQRNEHHPRAIEINSLFEEEAYEAGSRLLTLRKPPGDFQEALPQLLACLS